MMRTARVGDALHLVRRPIEVDPTAVYEEVGIRSFGRGFFPKHPILGIELGGKRMFEINAGDLVLNIVFAWEGVVALAGPKEHKRCASHRSPTYVADPELCDPRYLCHFFTTPKGRTLLGHASPGSAGRNRTLNLRAFEAIRIELPSVEEQRRIANRIEAMVKRIVAARELRLAAGDASTKLIGSILGQFDRSAPKVPLAEVLSLTTDEVPVELDQTYHTAGIYSFGRGLFARPPITGAETRYKSFFRLHRDQLVLSRLKAWEGAIAIVTQDFDSMCVSPEYPTFEVNRERAEPTYLGWLCRWDRFWTALLAQSKGVGARRDRVHPNRLLTVQVPLPPLEEQRRLAGIAKATDELDKVIRGFDTAFKALGPSIIGAAIDGGL